MNIKVPVSCKRNIGFDFSINTLKIKPMKVHARFIQIFAALLVLSAVFLPGCNQADTPPLLYKQPSGLTILGLDGATWEVIDLLIARGELPGFKRLKEEGAWGQLQTYVPTESVSIWTTMATGVSPSRHGIQTFTRRIPGTDRYVPVPGTDRRVPALWNLVSDAGDSVVSVKWFASWPAEKVNGAMLSPRLEAEDDEPRTYPRELYAEIDPFRHMTTMDQLPQPPRRRNPMPAGPSNPANGGPAAPAAGIPGQPPMLIGQDQVEATMFDDTSVWLAGKYVYDKYQPDLFMIYLKSTDRVEHFLWGAHEGNDPDPQRQQEAEAIYGWYRYYDGLIQECLEDPHRALMVISDHGMRAQSDIPEPYYLWDIDFDGILSIAGFLNRTPAGTRWNATRAYTYRQLPYDKTVLYRLNLAGREPQGMVPDDATVETTKALVQALSEFETTDGRRLFTSIRNTGTPGEISVTLSDAVTLNDAIAWNDKRIDLKHLVVRRGLPRGIHTDAPPGIIALHGPGISAGRHIDRASVFDVTPTALYLLNLPVARDFDGRVVTDFFSDAFQKSQPIVWTDTYGERAVETHLTTSDGDDRVLDELRALGYIN